MNETLGVEYVNSLDAKDPDDVKKVKRIHQDMAEYFERTQLKEAIRKFLAKNPPVKPVMNMIDDLYFSDCE